MIILLHEFGATAESSYFVKTVAPAFPDETVFSPTYPYLNAYLSAAQLHKFVMDKLANYPEDYELTFVGMSLGGFWARWLADQFHGSTLIMVNPALRASEDIIRCVKLLKESHNTDFTEENSKAFDQYFIEKDHHNLPITIIVADDDKIVPSLAEELIGSHRARIVHTTGGHKMRSTLPQHIEDIKFAVYNLTE